MAHKKAGGSSQNNRDSQSKRLGVKKYAGEKVVAGNIIIRQRGSDVKPGVGTMIAKDYTIFAVVDGFIKFTAKKTTRYNGKLKAKKFIYVTPARETAAATK